MNIETFSKEEISKIANEVKKNYNQPMCISSTSILSSFLFALIACISYFNFDRIKTIFKNIIYLKSKKSDNNEKTFS